VVYVYAGLAKLGGDWLLGAQPLNIWMSARIDTPVIGPMLDEWWVALAMSWAGFLFDTTIVAFLLWRRTRPFAYAVVVVFHFFTGVFFAIGMFPFIMTVAATIFFEPDWPRRIPGLRTIVSRGGEDRPDDARSGPTWVGYEPPPSWILAPVALWCALHVTIPLRHFAYPGDVLWDEVGMRWSWKVMVREKNGSVTYRVRSSELPGERYVYPSKYLTDHQEREMSGQPDMIVQLGQHIGRELEAAGHEDVEVRVDAWASLNGRRPARLIDPDVDLMDIDLPLVETPGTRPDWIEPAPTEPPIRLER
jgi:hypothetical protein